MVKGEHLHMRCAAHVLNLIVSDGLKVINPSIKRVRDAVRFVKYSPARQTRFKECCLEENIDCSSLLCLDVPTRWNSTYLMLSVAIKFEKAFDRFEVEDPLYRKTLSGKDASGVPTLLDWDAVRRICDLLLIFYELTLKVSASLHVTSHLIYQEIDRIGNLLKDWIGDIEGRDTDMPDSYCPYVREMVEAMLLKFKKYWGSATTMNKLIYLGHILDPRYKFKYISVLFKEDYGDEEGSKLLDDLKIALKKLFEHYRCFNQLQSQSSSTSVDSRRSQSQSKSMESSLSSHSLDSLGPPQKKAKYSGRLELIRKMEAQSGELVHKTELDVYLDEETLKCEDQDFKILKWWEVHQGRFPILSLVARDIFAMPISTVPSESAFSTGGRVLDPFRSSLTPKIVESLVCSQNWLRKRSSIMVFEEDLASLMKHEEGIQNIGTRENEKGKGKDIEFVR